MIQDHRKTDRGKCPIIVAAEIDSFFNIDNKKTDGEGGGRERNPPEESLKLNVSPSSFSFFLFSKPRLS